MDALFTWRSKCIVEVWCVHREQLGLHHTGCARRAMLPCSSQQAQRPLTCFETQFLGHPAYFWARVPRVNATWRIGLEERRIFSAAWSPIAAGVGASVLPPSLVTSNGDR